MMSTVPHSSLLKGSLVLIEHFGRKSFTFRGPEIVTHKVATTYFVPSKEYENPSKVNLGAQECEGCVHQSYSCLPIFSSAFWKLVTYAMKKVIKRFNFLQQNKCNPHEKAKSFHPRTRVLQINSQANVLASYSCVV